MQVPPLQVRGQRTLGILHPTTRVCFIEFILRRQFEAAIHGAVQVTIHRLNPDASVSQWHQVSKRH